MATVTVPLKIVKELHPDADRVKIDSAVWGFVRVQVKHLIEQAVAAGLEAGGAVEADGSDLGLNISFSPAVDKVVRHAARRLEIREGHAAGMYLQAAIDAGFGMDASISGPRDFSTLDPEVDAKEIFSRTADVELTLPDIQEFSLVHETEKARLWACQHGRFWEQKRAPIRLYSQHGGLLRAAEGEIVQALQSFTLVSVKVIQDTPAGGVQVEFDAQSDAKRAKKKAWLFKDQIITVGAATYVDTYQLKQKLTAATDFGRKRAGRSNVGKIADWGPVVTGQNVDKPVFNNWLQMVVAQEVQAKSLQ